MNLSFVLLLSLLLESSYANNVRQSKGIPRRSRRLAEGDEPKGKSSKKSTKSPSEKEADKAAKEADKAAKEAEKAANEDTPAEPTGYQVPMTEVLDQDSQLTAPPQTDGIVLTAPPQMQNEPVQDGTASPTNAVQTNNQFQQANKPADVQDPILVTDSKYSPSVGGNIADLTVQCVGDCTTDCAMFSANKNYFDGVLEMDYQCVTKCMDGKNDICANLKLCQNKC